MAVHARQTTVGVNIATSGSWGTGAAVATAVGVGDGVYVRDDLDVQLQVMQSEDDSAGQDFMGSVHSSNEGAITGKIPLYLHYHDTFFNPFLALAFGTGSTTPQQQGGSTAYAGFFEHTTTKTGRYATIVRDQSVDIHEVPGAKFTGFELRAADMGRFEIDFAFIGSTEKNDSTINTATQVSALTFPTQGLRAFLHQANFRVNAQGGAGLAVGDRLPITGITVRVSQPLDAIHVGGLKTIIEPEENDFPSVEIEVQFPRYAAAVQAFFAGHKDGTAYKADLLIDGPAIGTLATTYLHALDFPNVYVSQYQAPSPGGAGQIQPSATFRALSTTTAPTAMGNTTPIRWRTVGVNSGNALV